MKNKFNLIDRLRSFRFAFAGIATLFKTQHNAWVHAFASLIVITAGLYFSITSSEWCLLILAIMAVWTAEALNTAFEFLADVASPDFHPLVKHAKDVAAGAVLISTVGAVFIGLLIFGPYLIKRTESMQTSGVSHPVACPVESANLRVGGI